MNEQELDESQDPRRLKLDEIGILLEKQKDEAIAWKTKYEPRISEARRQYAEGYTRLNDTKAGTDPLKQPEYRRGVDNITKSRVLKGAARIGDTLFPTNDSNYSIQPSPSPTASPLLQVQGVSNDTPVPNGTPVDPNLAESAELDEIDSSAEEMENEVKDALDECNYSGVGRMAVFEGCKTGTGVIHGPFPKRVMKKATHTVQTPLGPLTKIIYEEATVPWAENIDVDEFFPQPAKNMKECGHVFRLQMMTKKQIGDLKKQGFDPDQIDRLLMMEPDAGALLTRPSVRDNEAAAATMRDRYAMWKYNGPVDKECLEYFSVELGANASEERDGEVWFCQGITCKAALSEIEGLPYHVWCYEYDDESIFGKGIPHACFNDQFDANVAWGTIKKNAIECASPVYGILKGTYEAEPGDSEMPPRSRVLILNSDLPLNQVMQTTTIQSNIADLVMVYQQAKQNADEHTMMQTLEEGAPSNVQVGQAVLAMIQQGNNIIQRYAAKTWDDNITVPLIGMFVKFELLYGDNEKAKGVFDVIPKASSHFLEKDMKAQHLLQLLAVADNPENKAMFKRREIIEDLIHVMDAPVKKYMNTKKEQAAIEQQMAQQPNPELMKIEAQKEIEQMKITGDMELAKFKAQEAMLVARMTMVTEEMRASNDGVKSEAENATRLRMKELDNEAKVFGEVKKDLREREKTAAQMTLEAEKLASKEAGDMLEVEVEKTPRLA